MEGSDIAVAGIHVPQADQLFALYSCEYVGTAIGVENETLKLADQGSRLKQAHAKSFFPEIKRTNKRLAVLDKELQNHERKGLKLKNPAEIKAHQETMKPLLEERKNLTARLEEIQKSSEIFDKTDPGLQRVKKEITDHNSYLQAILGNLSYSDPNAAGYVRNLVAEWDKGNPLAASAFVGVDYGAGSLLSR